MTGEDRTVQVPASLPTREQIAEALYRHDQHEDWLWAEEKNKATRDSYLSSADAVLALFSQPTPTTEHKPDCDRASELSTRCDCHVGQAALSEPFRSEEVVPDARESLCPRCGGSGCVGLADCRVCLGTGIDPTTIRDVTPPAGGADGG